MTAHIGHAAAFPDENKPLPSPRDHAVSGSTARPAVPRTVFRQLVGKPFQCEWTGKPGEQQYVELAQDKLEVRDAKRLFAHVQTLVQKVRPDLASRMRIRVRLERIEEQDLGRHCAILWLDAKPDSAEAQLVGNVINALKVELEKQASAAPEPNESASSDASARKNDSLEWFPVDDQTPLADGAARIASAPCTLDRATGEGIVSPLDGSGVFDGSIANMSMPGQAASEVPQLQPEAPAHLRKLPQKIQASLIEKASALANMLSSVTDEVIRIDDGEGNTLVEVCIPPKQAVEDTIKKLPAAEYQLLALDRQNKTIKLGATIKRAKKIEVGYVAEQFLDTLELAFVRLKDLGGGTYERDATARDKAGFPLINATLEEVRKGNKIEQYKLKHFDVIRTTEPKTGLHSAM